MHPSIFINYRRKDSLQSTRWLYSEIKEKLGNEWVFMDEGSISLGELWPDSLRKSLQHSKIMLSIIGPDWLTERLQDEDDWVRQEIEYALKEENGIQIIPVFIEINGKTLDPETLERSPLLPESMRGWSNIQRKVISEIHSQDNIRGLIDDLKTKLSWKTNDIIDSTKWLSGKQPFLPKQVIGRNDQLLQLRRLLNAQYAPVVIYGIRGIGKTTLSQFFVEKYSHDYDHILLLEQRRDFEDVLLGDRILHHNLGIDSNLLKGNATKDIPIILNYLNNLPGKNLIVIDNVDESIEQWLDKLPLNWHRLITSNYKIEHCEMFNLPLFNLQEAKQLFYTYYKRGEENDIVEQILHTIGFHTLTTELIAKLANVIDQSLDHLLQALKKREINIEEEVRIWHNKDQKVSNVFFYLREMFDIEDTISKSAVPVTPILKSFAALPPMHWHTEEDLLAWMDILTDEYDDFRKAMDLLSQLGWIQSSERTLDGYNKLIPCYYMHPIIQDVILTELGLEYDDIFEYMEKLLIALDLEYSVQSPATRFALIPYGDRLINLLPQSDDYHYFSLLFRLGRIQTESGQYKKATTLLKRAFGILTNLDEPHHYHIVHTQNLLGVCYLFSGKIKESEEQFKSVLEMLESLGQSKSPLYMQVNTNLATALTFQGELQQAEDIYSNMGASNLGNRLSDMIPTLNLGEVYMISGKFDEALRVTEDGLINLIEHTGEDDYRVGMYMASLANINFNANRLNEAKYWGEKALKISEERLDAHHYQVILCRSTIGQIQLELGDEEQAEYIFKKALEDAIDELGEEHIQIIVCRDALAHIYKNQGKLPEAIDMLRTNINGLQKLYGSDDPGMIINHKTNIAGLLLQQGALNEALHIFETELAQINNHINNVEGKTEKLALQESKLTLLNSTNFIYLALGDYTKAKELILNAKQLLQEHFADNENIKIQLLFSEGVINRILGKVDDALFQLEEGYRLMEKLYGLQNEDAILVEATLGELYRQLGRLDDSEKLLVKAKTKADLLCSPNDINRAIVNSNLSITYLETSRYAEARDLLEDSMNTIKTYDDPSNPVYAAIKANYGLALVSTGDVKESFKLINETAASISREYKDHPILANLYSNLANIYFQNDLIAEAIEHNNAAIRIGKLHLPEHNLSYLEILFSQAEFLSASGNYSKAEDLYKKVLRILEINYSDSRQRIIMTILGLSQLYESTNRMELCIDYGIRAYQLSLNPTIKNIETLSQVKAHLKHLHQDFPDSMQNQKRISSTDLQSFIQEEEE